MKQRVLFTVLAVLFTKATFADNGAQLFQYHCAHCHAEGPGHPGTQALAFKYQQTLPAVLTQRTDLNADFVMHYIRNGGGSMPFFRKTEISDIQASQIIQFLTERPEPHREQYD